jgi:ribosomal protein L40E
VETDDVVRCPYCDKSCDYETVSRLAAEFKAKQAKQSGNPPIFFGFITVVIGILFLFVFPIAGIALIVGGIAGAAVYDDAYKRGDSSPGAWALGTWLLLIIVLPLYLYHRAYGSKGEGDLFWTCTSGHANEARYADIKMGRAIQCSRCSEIYDKTRITQGTTTTLGNPTVSGATILTMFCRECGAKIPRDSKFCKECGTKVVL